MRFPNSPAMLESTRGIVWSAEWEIRNASGASTQWDHRPIVSAQSCSSACKDTTTSSSSSSSTISVPHLFSLTAAVRPPAPSPEDPPPAPPPWAFPCCRGIESCRWKLPTRPDPTPPPTPPPAPPTPWLLFRCSEARRLPAVPPTYVERRMDITLVLSIIPVAVECCRRCGCRLTQMQQR